MFLQYLFVKLHSANREADYNIAVGKGEVAYRMISFFAGMSWSQQCALSETNRSDARRAGPCVSDSQDQHPSSGDAVGMDEELCAA